MICCNSYLNCTPQCNFSNKTVHTTDNWKQNCMVRPLWLMEQRNGTNFTKKYLFQQRCETNFPCSSLAMDGVTLTTNEVSQDPCVVNSCSSSSLRLSSCWNEKQQKYTRLMYVTTMRNINKCICNFFIMMEKLSCMSMKITILENNLHWEIKGTQKLHIKPLLMASHNNKIEKQT